MNITVDLVCFNNFVFAKVFHSFNRVFNLNKNYQKMI